MQFNRLLFVFVDRNHYICNMNNIIKIIGVIGTLTFIAKWVESYSAGYFIAAVVLGVLTLAYDNISDHFKLS